MSEFLNMDCMEGMSEYADNHFDLAIVDPPYGIGDWTTDINVYNKNGVIQKRVKKRQFKKVDWNENIPNEKYFNELKRVSKKQIIWGANYYNSFSNLGGAVIWYKGGCTKTFSQCEIASLSFQKRVDYVKVDWQSGFFRKLKEGTQCHPCQKPVELYRWLLKNYAKEGDLILDTHVGSASSLVACEEMGFKYVGYELDKDYYDSACKRLKNHTNQVRMI